MAQYSRRTTFDAGAVSFVVQHELWDGNIDDHSDQGVAILVTGQAGGKRRRCCGSTVSTWSAAMCMVPRP